MPSPALSAMLPKAQDLASNSTKAALTQEAPKGKHVTLRVGPGFSLSAADGIAGVLEKNGCPTTVTRERGFPKRVTVEVEEKKFKFTTSGSAGSQALDWCLDKS